MGYCSSFDLSIYKNNTEKDDIVVKHEIGCILSEKNIIGYALDHDLSCNGNSVKWKSHIEDMRDVSKKVANVIIMLYREGEETMDCERLYFYNGMMIKFFPHITWDDTPENIVFE